MLFWIIYILIEAFIQGKLIKKGDKPNYFVLFLIRGIFAIIHGGPILNVQNNREWLILLGWQTCSFEAIFDFFLNLLRMEKWNYKGHTSGYIDTLPYPWWYTLKIVSIIGAITFYILGLNIWKF